MIVLPRTSTGRIALAIVLSALVHAIVLLAPLVKLPPAEAPLPPLIAKLEPLPKIAAQPAPPRRPKPKPQPAPPVPAETLAADQPAENVSTEEPQIDAAPQPQTAEGPAKKTMEEPRPVHPLPKHAQLTFVAYKGTDFAIGEMRHHLEIGDDKNYIIHVGMNTTGLASIFKTYESDQQSSGTLTAQGLRPSRFNETKNTSKGKEMVEAKFAWKEKVLSFSNGNSMPLPEQAQDIVSFLYQLSQLALDKDAIQMYISNGKKLESYKLSIGEEEMVQTGIGWLRALPLRKAHLQGEEGLDVWLGLEYRLLPVKIRMIDRTGKIAGEMVISEIRVADE
ncbi:MAG TPA: DUF3108 domain-containing protein [Gallionella sp.]|nr:DUF3108 domain-containing protein [Gallionella sp.]